MHCIIIAGGDSTRLQPVPDKNLLSYFGETLIERQLRIISAVKDITRVIIVGNPANLDAIRTLGEKWKKRFEIMYQVQDKPRGLEDAILCGGTHVGKEPLLLLASNDVVELSAYRLLLTEAKKGLADALLLASRVTAYFPGGYIEMDDKHLIKRIVEKPKPGTEPSDLVNIVIHWYRNGAAFVEALQQAKKHVKKNNNWYDVTLERMIAQGAHIQAVPYAGIWRAVKYPWHVLDVMQYMFAHEAPKSYRAKSAVIAKQAVIKGPVWIEEGVKIFEGAIISGPAYIGKNTIIGNNVLVRESCIGANSVIGFGSEIARSYVGSGVYMHTNYVGDSIICDEVAFGAGTVTGNLRLDGKNVQVEVEKKKVDTGRTKFGATVGPRVHVGINSSLMPGVRIGAGAFIGAGVQLAKHVSPGQFVHVKQTHTIVKNRVASTPTQSKKS